LFLAYNKVKMKKIPGSMRDSTHSNRDTQIFDIREA